MTPASRPAVTRPSRHPDEAGTSLIELLVILALMSIVLPTLYGTMSFVQRQTRLTVDRFTATSNAQIGMDRLSRELRAATGVTVSPSTTPAVFPEAGAQDVTFYSSLENPIPALIHACLAASGATACPVSPAKCYGPAPSGSAWPGCSLLEVITQGTGTVLAPVYTGTAKSHVDVVNVSSAGTVFAYHDKTGAVISASNLATSAGLASIETVVLTITAQAGPTSPSAPLAMTVPLPNVDYALGS